MRALAGVGLAAVVLAGCGVRAEPGPTEVEVEESSKAWRQLPDPPLSPRNYAVVVGVEDRMLVVGGWEYLCPPDGDCLAPDGPWFTDGAVYDRGSDSWSPITPAPFGLIRGEHAAAALGDSAYLLSDCADGPACDAAPRLLSYDLAEDRWSDHGPVPGPRHSRHLVPLAETLLVHSGSDERGAVADLVFDPARSIWTELPDDPLPRSYDRSMAPAGEQLVLAASPIDPPGGGAESATLAARYDPATARWVRLPDAPGNAYRLLPAGRGALFNGRFVDSPGWLLDPDTWAWSELPAAAGEDHDLSGVLDRGGAIYDIPNSVGQMTAAHRLLVYDTDAETFVPIPALPPRSDVHDDSSAALGRDLFVYGGQRWSDAEPADDGELVGDAWLWTAPTR